MILVKFKQTKETKKKGRDQQAVVFALDFSERLLWLWSKLPVKDARQSRNGGVGFNFWIREKSY